MLAFREGLRESMRESQIPRGVVPGLTRRASMPRVVPCLIYSFVSSFPTVVERPGESLRLGSVASALDVTVPKHVDDVGCSCHEVQLRWQPGLPGNAQWLQCPLVVSAPLQFQNEQGVWPTPSMSGRADMNT